jgi:hypothetical protein
LIQRKAMNDARTCEASDVFRLANPSEEWRGVKKVDCSINQPFIVLTETKFSYDRGVQACRKFAGAELLGAVRRRDNTMLARWLS